MDKSVKLIGLSSLAALLVGTALIFIYKSVSPSSNQEVIQLTIPAQGVVSDEERTQAKSKLSILKLDALKYSVYEYVLRTNKAPDSLSDLLCKSPNSGPCVPTVKQDDLKDAWDNPIQLEKRGTDCILWSLGNDAERGGNGPGQDTSAVVSPCEN